MTVYWHYPSWYGPKKVEKEYCKKVVKVVRVENNCCKEREDKKWEFYEKYLSGEKEPPSP